MPWGAYPRFPEFRVPLWRRVLARLGFPTVVFWDVDGFERPVPVFLHYCRWHGVYALDILRTSGCLLCPHCAEDAERMHALLAGGGHGGGVDDGY